MFSMNKLFHSSQTIRKVLSKSFGSSSKNINSNKFNWLLLVATSTTIAVIYQIDLPKFSHCQEKCSEDELKRIMDKYNSKDIAIEINKDISIQTESTKIENKVIIKSDKDNNIINSNKDKIESLRPNPKEYTRIDKIMSEGELKHWIKDHAIFDSLNGDGRIEAYEVYHKNNSDEILALITFGKSLNGYPKIVHGGISALLFDNSFGFLFFALKTPKAVTANLNINYKKPIYADSCVILKAKMDSKEGRKLKMSATMEDSNGLILAESSTLFITLQTKQVVLMQANELLTKTKKFFS